MASDEVRFDGKVILVTGAGRGMGRDHALLLASRGAQIVVADNGSAMDGSQGNAGPAESVGAEIRKAGGMAVACTADLSTEDGSTAAVQAGIDAYGRIDGILHNASTSPNLAGPDETSSEQLDLVLRVNVYAGFWLTRAAWPHMEKQGGGRIVYVGSHSVYGVGGAAPYASAKSAYLGMARSFAPDGAKANITCNVVFPTARTRMTERMPASDYSNWLFEKMDPVKVALGVAYLLNQECTINGEVFSIGGGRISRVRLAETPGVMDAEDSIEDMRDALLKAMTQDEYFFPRDQQERVSIVHPAMGFTGTLGHDAYAVKDVN
jgi:NAD(P)-dependent dehydrogenase (short-subunit alcohol dehydrogenase family)